MILEEKFSGIIFNYHLEFKNKPYEFRLRS